MKKQSNNSVDAASGRDKRVRQALVNFRRIMTTVKRHLTQDGQGDGALSGAQMWALWHVQTSPGITVLELADKLSVHQSTTSNLVDKLESAGCLRRERLTLDRRVVRLYVTRAGGQVLKRAPGLASGTLPEALHRLTGPELAALEQALQSLTRELGTGPKHS